MTVERGRQILGGLLILAGLSSALTGQTDTAQFVGNAVVACIGLALIVWPKGKGLPKK